MGVAKRKMSPGIQKGPRSKKMGQGRVMEAICSNGEKR